MMCHELGFSTAMSSGAELIRSSSWRHTFCNQMNAAVTATMDLPAIDVGNYAS